MANNILKSITFTDSDEVYTVEAGLGKQTDQGGEIFNDYVNNSAGNNAHAEGTETKALGKYAHAEGWRTKASNSYSHAEGTETEATNLNTHAEGYKTKATGQHSHAEGKSTIAEGSSSHAEGSGTSAKGSSSHAEGYHTQAQGRYQHVQGKYNIADTNNKYAHIVGNGTADTECSNAHTLDWDGNAWFAGSVECTAIILKSPNGIKFQITVDDNGSLNTKQI